MMALWAPDLVMPAARAELADKIACGGDVFELTGEAFSLVSVVIGQVTEQEETSHLGLWEFIYVLLVFMRAMATRPDMLQRFGWALRPELLAPYLNTLLVEAKVRRGSDWDKTSPIESPKLYSPLNQTEKLGKYGMTTNDHIREAQEKNGDTQSPNAEPINRTLTLREHFLLRGHSFAREPDSYWKPEPRHHPKKVSAHTVTPGLKREAEEVRLEEERNDREAEVARLQELEREKALRIDPPFFRENWFDNSMFNSHERVVMQEVQSIEVVEDRYAAILALGRELVGSFFRLETNSDGLPLFSVPKDPPVRQLGPDVQMPEVVEREGGGRFVYVDPSFAAYVAKLDETRKKKEEWKLQWEEKEENKRKKREAEKAEAGGEVATFSLFAILFGLYDIIWSWITLAMYETAEGDEDEVSAANCSERTQHTNMITQQRAQSERPIKDREVLVPTNVPVESPGIIREPDSAFDLELLKANGVATTSAKNPIGPENGQFAQGFNDIGAGFTGLSNEDKEDDTDGKLNAAAEVTKATEAAEEADTTTETDTEVEADTSPESGPVEAETALPVRGDNGYPQDTTTSTTTTVRTGVSTDAAAPSEVVPLTREMLDKIPLTEEAERRVALSTAAGDEGSSDSDGWTHVSNDDCDGTTTLVRKGTPPQEFYDFTYVWLGLDVRSGTGEEEVREGAGERKGERLHRFWARH